MHGSAIYRRGRLLAYARVSATTSASNATVPKPAGVTVPPLVALLECPTTNTDNVRFAITGTAVSTDRLIIPGGSLETPLGRNTTISIISDSGTQNLDITAFYA